MSRQAWFKTATAIAIGTLVSSPLTLVHAQSVLTVQAASQAKVVINPNTTIRAQVPQTLYSFNMRYNQFEQELWDNSQMKVKQPITDTLVPMPQVFYRYPGGVVSNHFEWEKAALPLADRIAKRKSGGGISAYPYFGPKEYLNWMGQTNGFAWWTLNLLGRGSVDNPIELPSATMAESNKNLAKFLKANYPKQTKWYYQLGNELDRNHYEWSHEKYVSRSRDSINAILSVDPSAKFVAFMRNFSWKYKTRTGTSTAQQFFTDVMKGLPMINDFSLHFYYDGKLSPTAGYQDVPNQILSVQKAVAMAKAARPGNYGVWITEHSKRLLLSGGTPVSPNALDTGIGVGDFILAMTQMPEVQGTGLQALQGDRSVFFPNTLTGTPALWTLRMLETQPYPRVLASTTYSPNKSLYPGGYDIRAVGFTDSTMTKLGVQAVNRYKQAQTLEINFAPFKGKAKKMKHYSMSGAAGVDPATIERTYKLVTAPAIASKTFSTTGSVTITLPPSSVSTITFE